MKKQFENYIIEISNNEISIIKYEGNDYILEIPSQIDNLKVTKIQKEAFANIDKMCYVSIPATIKSIGDNAFFGCVLMKEVNIPNSVIEIGKAAFGMCCSLEKIKIDNSHSIFCFIDNALFNKQTNTLLCYLRINKQKNYIIPKGIFNIDEYAFGMCDSLEKIIFHKNVKEIGIGSFSWCINLSQLEFENNEYYMLIEGALFDVNKNSLHTYLCYNKKHHYEVPDGTKIINSAAFFMSNTMFISLPDSIISVEESAFSSSQLVQINIPENLISVEDTAFEFCGLLEQIIISDKNPIYTVIDGVLFDKKEHKLHTYFNTNNNKSYKIPEGTEKISSFAFCSCEKLTSVRIPKSVISVQKSSFKACQNLNSIELSSSDYLIEEEAFSLCTNLVLKVPKNTYSHKYALDNNIPFEII